MRKIAQLFLAFFLAAQETFFTVGSPNFIISQAMLRRFFSQRFVFVNLDFPSPLR